MWPRVGSGWLFLSLEQVGLVVLVLVCGESNKMKRTLYKLDRANQTMMLTVFLHLRCHKCHWLALDLELGRGRNDQRDN